MKTSWILLLLLLHFFSMPFDSTLASRTNVTDKEALLAFKENLEGNSALLSTWNNSIHFCKWQGVICSHKHPQRVSALNLPSSGLVGSISAKISNLTFLSRVNLESNELYGEIPPSLSYLEHLQFLNLHNNSLEGEIFTYLYNCSSLSIVNVSLNNLTGQIPSRLELYMPKLQVFDIAVNGFYGVIPPSLGNLSFLREIHLHRNKLEGAIPEGLGRLSQIQVLDLYANNLSDTIPQSLYNLTEMSYFDLSLNSLQGSLPPWTGTNQRNLEHFNVGGNRLVGEIPTSLSNASKIAVLALGWNYFSGLIPPELGRLCPMGFYLYSNYLEATVPNDWQFLNFLTNCTRLNTLILSDNYFFSGKLPNSFTNLSSQLQVLRLDGNYLSGTIPASIGNLIGVQVLMLGRNFLSGPIPSTIGKLIGLTLLNFHGSYLTNIIPESIGKLYNLQVLNLQNNTLSGLIPPSIGNLTRLSSLFLNENSLEGSIPTSIENLKALTTLDLSKNALNGTLPGNIFSIPSLSIYLNLSHNSLVGTIPVGIGGLTTVGAIDLSANYLSGELPNTLSNCVGLEYLTLDNNNLTGGIPRFLNSLKGLRVINLTCNSFTGEIPWELGNMDGLQELYLSYNNLSGSIPEVLENLSSLSRLDLSYNHLEGNVPTKGVFSNTTTLSIQGNNGVCGGIRQLMLPPCAHHHDAKSSRLLPKVLPIVGSVLCLFFVLLIYVMLRLRAKSREGNTIASLLGYNHPQVSYHELARATDGFDTTNLVGSGKYGAVYKGNLPIKKKGPSAQEIAIVAVKVFNLQVLGSLTNFVAECKVLRQIRHRNLIRIQTCCSSVDSDGSEFKALVFDFMHNGSLDTWLHTKANLQQPPRTLNLIQRLNIAIDVANALDYLHNNCHPPVVHCDIKPSNVLLDEHLTACVGDFGLAKFLFDALSKSSQDSQSILLRGSIGYIAPEYGAGAPVSTHGDVYSFGILLLEMFIGKKPTDGMFQEGLSLHEYAEMAYPEHILQVVDPTLLQGLEENLEEDTFGNYPEEYHERRSEIKTSRCLASAINLGLMCSKQSAQDRVSMRIAAVKIHAIREEYLGEEAN